MGLNFKKNEITSLEDLKEKNSDLYTQLLEEAKHSGSDEAPTLSEKEQALVEENNLLKNQIAKTKRDTEAKTLADDLKIELSAEDLEKSDSELYLGMLNSLKEKEKNVEDAFAETASNTAGVSNEDGDEEEPKSFNEAMLFIADRDGISKTEASEKAMNEFSDLFNKLHTRGE